MVLFEYGIKFIKQPNGYYKVKANSFNLAMFISAFIDINIIDSFISDLKLAIDGNFDQIEDPDWDREIGADVYFGVIQPDLTLQVNYENDLDVVEYFPLSDIKEIFTIWRAFLES